MAQSTRKPMFDVIRSLLGRGFTQAEVNRLNQALDRGLDGKADSEVEFSRQDSSSSAYGTPVVSVPKITRRNRAARTIGEAGTALIKRFEGCERKRSDGLIEAYPDPGTGGDPWTIGWGATGRDNNPRRYGRIGPGTVWTQAECDARLADDLMRYAADVARAIGDTPTSQSQFDALVSFHYNTGAIVRATLTRKHVARDFSGAAKEFARWNKAGGRVLKGLVRRRAAEAELYLS